jgi:hypothetical protein
LTQCREQSFGANGIFGSPQQLHTSYAKLQEENLLLNKKLAELTASHSTVSGKLSRFESTAKSQEETLQGMKDAHAILEEAQRTSQASIAALTNENKSLKELCNAGMEMA